MKNFLLKVFTIVLAVVIFNACNEPLVVDTENEGPDLKSAINAKKSYIVVLQDDNIDFELSDLKGYQRKQEAMNSISERILNRAGIIDGEVEHVYGTAIKGFSVLIPPGQLKKLQDEPSVKYIEEDKIFTLGKPKINILADNLVQGQDVQPWGIKRINGGVVYEGSNVAWIIDSGIDFDHPELIVDQSRGANFTRAKSADDDNGHGTHVAGTIAAIYNSEGVVGVAAGATVIPIKVLDRRGSGWTSEIIDGIDFVASNGSVGDVANMSLGGGVSTTLDNAVIAAAATGIKFVLAAGNEYGDAKDHSPARANGTNVYTVSAMGEVDIWADFSNSGNPPIEYCAPGVDILSCYYGGRYAIASGTSMAAPHVAGLLLLGNTTTDGNVIDDPDNNPDPILVYNGNVTPPPPTENVEPIAGFTFNIDVLNVTFTDTSSDFDGNVVSWDWDFGDGGNSSAQNPSHLYGKAATYPVILTVTDDDNATKSITKNITITENQSSGEITLSGNISGNKVKKATLTWTGTNSLTVDIYKDDAYYTTVSNSGSYNDNLGKIDSGTFSYYIIDEFGTESNHETVSVI